MDQLIRDNISAIFTLIGIFVGAALSFLGTLVLNRNEAKTRLLEKVLDRRIAANEQVIKLAHSMRLMVSMGHLDKSGDLARTPNILTSREALENWMELFTQTSGQATTWLSTDLTRELNLVQDYIITLCEYLRPARSDKFPEIGVILRQDFIDFSDALEKLAFEFFAHELTKFKLNDLQKWHKYPRQVTEKRIGTTALMTRTNELAAIINIG